MFSPSRLWLVFSGLAKSDRAGKVDEPVTSLLRSNLDQWTLEDLTRDSHDPIEVAEAKGKIDERNAARVAIVAEIDRLAAEVLLVAPSAPPLTDTPGAAIDRLTIDRIRAWTPAQRRSARQREAIATEPMAPDLEPHLFALQTMIEDLLSGHRSFILQTVRKQYGSRSA